MLMMHRGRNGVSTAVRRANGSSLLLKAASSRAVPVQAISTRFFSVHEDSKDDKKLVYEAPMAKAVRLMKGVSVTSCILTSVGMPTLCMISEQSASVVGKWAMCGTVMLFGLGTTSLFHYLFKPYVIRMWVSNQQDHEKAEVTVETVTLFARLQQQSFPLAAVTRPESSMHPMISFKAGDKNFFIHTECFEDKELAARLSGMTVQQLEESSSKTQN